jgi:class 3 adenylate cyclase/TolB-like protein
MPAEEWRLGMTDSPEQGLRWPDLQRARRSVLVVDVVESVRLMQSDEAGAVARWRSLVRGTTDAVLPATNGRMVKSLGDGMLLEFERPSQALVAALEIRGLLPEANRTSNPTDRISLRFGIHVCEVFVDSVDIYGQGVNLAARIAAQAPPNEIYLSDAASTELLPALDAPIEDLGDMWFKHVSHPVRVYRVCEPHGQDIRTLQMADEKSLLPSIAVLPFASAGEVDAAMPLGELLADDLICALSALPDLRVVSRLSTSPIARRRGSLREAASAFNTDYVLDGICRTSGSKVLVQAQLLDCRRDEVVQNLRIADDVGSLLVEDSPVVAHLIERVAASMIARQVELAHRCALPNLAGYSLLLGGIALLHRLGRRDFERAHELLSHLSDRWPRMATPRAWLARWHLLSYMQGYSADPVASRRQALDDCKRALDLDSSSSVALAVAGSVKVGLARDVDGGMTMYQEALRNNPNDSFAWMLLGTAHAFKGEGTPATQAGALAISLSPFDPMHFMYDCHAAGTALAADDHAQAIALAQRSLRANAQHLSTYRVLAIAQQLSGAHVQASATIAKLRALDPKQSVERYLRNSPSAEYEIGRRFAAALQQAGLPQSTG